MKSAIALLLSALLAACAMFGPDDYEPSGHMTVESTLGPAHLYRPNPNEKPTIERVEIAPGKFKEVQVWAYRCFGKDANAAYSLDAIYLCNKPEALPHELAHQKGMKHTEWVDTGVAKCSKIIAAGYKTGYTPGTTICVKDGFEWTEK